VVARLWLVPHDGVFYLVPVFALAATLFGLVNGLVAARLLEAEAEREPARAAAFARGRQRGFVGQAEGGAGQAVGVRVAVARHPFQHRCKASRERGAR
jgi:hypothetical protein